MAIGQRGRKPRGNYKQKSAVFSTRIRADTKAALEAAAKEQGHSLSQEAERRLRRSFDEDRGLFEKLGGRRNYAVLRLIAALMGTVSNPYYSPETSWLDDRRLFDQLVKMVDTVFAELRPLGPDQPEDEVDLAARNVESNQKVAFALLAVRDAPPELPIDATNPATFIRSDLGPVAERIGRQPGRAAVSGNSLDFRREAEELKDKEGSDR